MLAGNRAGGLNLRGGNILLQLQPFTQNGANFAAGTAIAAGTQFTVALQNDGGGNVTGATFSAAAPNAIANAVPTQNPLPAAWTQAANYHANNLAPIAAFQFDFTGSPAILPFASGAPGTHVVVGEITYTAMSPITVWPNFLSCVPGNPPAYTAEAQPNAFYGPITSVQGKSNTFTQTFGLVLQACAAGAWVNGSCVCPNAGQTFVNGQCVWSQGGAGAGPYIPSCPLGQFYSVENQKCMNTLCPVETDGMPSSCACPPGYYWASLAKTCFSKCNGSLHWNSKTNSCVNDCPAGTAYNGPTDTCVSETKCPTGQVYSAAAGQCIPQCSPNYRYDTAAHECVSTCTPPKRLIEGNCTYYCEPPSVYSAATGLCGPGPTQPPSIGPPDQGLGGR